MTFLGIWSGWKKCDRVWRLLSRSVCKWSVRAQAPQSQNVIFLLNVDNIFGPFRRVTYLWSYFVGLSLQPPKNVTFNKTKHGMVSIWLVRTLSVTKCDAPSTAFEKPSSSSSSSLFIHGNKHYALSIEQNISKYFFATWLYGAILQACLAIPFHFPIYPSPTPTSSPPPPPWRWRGLWTANFDLVRKWH